MASAAIGSQSGSQVQAEVAIEWHHIHKKIISKAFQLVQWEAEMYLTNRVAQMALPSMKQAVTPART